MLEEETELVPADCFALVQAAGGFAALPAWFADAMDGALDRYPPAGTVREAWAD